MLSSTLARAASFRPIAHDLRSLLAAALANAEYLRDLHEEGGEARDAWVAAQSDFPDVGLSPVILLVDVPGDPTSRDSILAIKAYAA